MDFDKIIKMVQTYSNDYIVSFYKILLKPTSAFQRYQPSKNHSRIIIASANDNTSAGLQIEKRIISFVLISIAIGVILNSFVPSRKYSGEFFSNMVIVFICWLFFVFYTHFLCRLFRGTASFLHTLSVSLQVFSALYVVSSFLNLAGGALVTMPFIASKLLTFGRLGDSIVNNPIYIYFIAQFILLNVYLPIAIKNIHGFGRIRPILIGVILSSLWVLLGIAFYLDLGIMYYRI
ncbi:hypothetical protein ACFL2G_03040 [Candidatus Omnitrophota bacterium]